MDEELPPHASAGKESACSAGDAGSTPGLRRPLEKEMATHSSILNLENSMARGAWQVYSPKGCKESNMTECTDMDEA